MKKRITGFHLDRFQEWVADLECGHGITMRHNPPYQNCPWIGSGKGRQEHIGNILECVKCDIPTLPGNVRLTKTSAVYHGESIPEEFTSGFIIADYDTWIKVVVTKGLLQFLIHVEPTVGFVLDEHLSGVIQPGVAHDIKPAMGEVEFFLEYYQVL